MYLVKVGVKVFNYNLQRGPPQLYPPPRSPALVPQTLPFTLSVSVGLHSAGTLLHSCLKAPGGLPDGRAIPLPLLPGERSLRWVWERWAN